MTTHVRDSDRDYNKFIIDCFHDPIMQHVLGGSLHKNNTTCLLLGLYHAWVNWLSIVLMQIPPFVLSRWPLTHNLGQNGWKIKTTPPPPISMREKWRVFVVARVHHWIGGRGTSISHLILSKIVVSAPYKIKNLFSAKDVISNYHDPVLITNFLAQAVAPVMSARQADILLHVWTFNIR